MMNHAKYGFSAKDLCIRPRQPGAATRSGTPLFAPAPASDVTADLAAAAAADLQRAVNKVEQQVRDALFARQRAFALSPGLVADGRDMGTVVFPQAEAKIFLTASAEERAERRFAQLKEKGYDVSIDRLLEEIRERDDRDANRKVAPLRPAEDALAPGTFGAAGGSRYVPLWPRWRLLHALAQHVRPPLPNCARSGRGVVPLKERLALPALLRRWRCLPRPRPTHRIATLLQNGELSAFQCIWVAGLGNTVSVESAAARGCLIRHANYRLYALEGPAEGAAEGDTNRVSKIMQ